ncbi:hypothetical protein BASA82_000434 [Batrachochytrium salamandrivorans]|nr:hypothetical protein BASA81_002999 [Batrachochytrium salamandrivorans]KAH9262504.1 hypothetical protein BASA82_000434 [Batrachochytrium salamandrivorans]
MRSSNRPSRSRSPPPRRARDRSRDRYRSSASSSSRSEEQARLREMLIREAAQRNPDAANVFAGKSSTDQDAMQRALSAANALGVTHAQNQQFLQQQHGRGGGGYRDRDHRGGADHYRGGGGSRPPGGGRGNGPNPDKIFYELHIGGISESVHDEEAFARFLNDACLHKQLNLEPGGPVQSTRINSAGRFAFALFRSREEASRGLELNGTEYNGCQLRVERPRGFQQLANTTNTAASMANAVPVMDEAQLIAAVLASTPVPTLMGFTREQLRVALENNLAGVGDSSSLVELGNFGGDHGDVLHDVEQEAKRYGQVLGIRPAIERGAFLVKMASLQDAEKLVQLKRQYNNRRITARFRPLGEWQPSNFM